MNNDKRTQNTPEELIQFALEQETPPLYRTREIDGVIVKYYPFIDNRSKIRKHKIPVKDIEQKDYSLLSAYKSELENQLKLNYKYCTNQYTHVIKNQIRNWLENKFEKAGWPLDSNKGKRRQFPLLLLVSHIHTLYFLILRGEEGKSALKKIKVLKIRYSDMAFNTPTEYNEYREEYESVISNISDLLDKLNWRLKIIERVVSRSVDLYLEYANIQSYLYDLNLEEVLAINNTEKLIETFVSEIFDPKMYERQMIEDYLKEWEQNQGRSYPRKKTVDKLKADYPILEEVSGSVILNWEDKWEGFRDARTEN